MNKPLKITFSMGKDKKSVNIPKDKDGLWTLEQGDTITVSGIEFLVNKITKINELQVSETLTEAESIFTDE